MNLKIKHTEEADIVDLTSTLINSSPAVGVPERGFKEPNYAHVIKDSS